MKHYTHAFLARPPDPTDWLSNETCPHAPEDITTATVVSRTQFPAG